MNLESIVVEVALKSVGLVLFIVVGTAWCLLVFLLTGRLPWMVRKYF